MKLLVPFLLFCVAHSCSAMKNQLSMQHLHDNLSQAIEEGDALTIKELKKIINSPERYSPYSTFPLLINKDNLDLNNLYARARKLTKEKELDMHKLCNTSFYKQLGLSLGCFGSAALISSLFIVLPLANGQYNIPTLCGAGTATSTLAALGIHHFRLAWNNHDAKNAYVQQLATQLLLKENNFEGNA